MNHRGPITCPFHAKGRLDAVSCKNLAAKESNQDQNDYDSYVKGYICLKAIMDSNDNIISNTDNWPAFAVEEYTRIRNRNIKL